VLAAVAPLVLDSPGSPGSAQPSWPDEFEGSALERVALSARDQRFARNFPGQVGSFTADGKRVLLRRIERATRELHPAADCYRGLGYDIQHLPIHVDPAGRFWSRFEAVRGSERVLVRERIFTAAGGSWSDVSSWYWSALWGSSPGPWFSATVAEAAPSNGRPS
jgi:hypothetical protein